MDRKLDITQRDYCGLLGTHGGVAGEGGECHVSCTMLPLSMILQTFSSVAILDARNISVQPGRIWAIDLGTQLKSGWAMEL